MAAHGTIVLAAGGTGGHIFPAEALGCALTERGHEVSLFTDARFAKYVSEFARVTVYTVHSASLSGPLFAKVRALVEIARGYAQARRLLKRMKPAVVVGFGGYPSFPTMLAARSLGIPTVIHEQNALLGRVNRALAAKVTAIAASFPHTQGIPPEQQRRVTVTGNPVRPAIRALARVPYPEMAPDGVLRLLVTGGSQGARVFSDIVPAAIAELPGGLRARLRVDQQCRAADLEETRAAYAAIGVSADLAAFFADVPARLASAHLVIARAGASTVAELMVARRPAILVPYPHAADDHQTVNANAAEETGGFWRVPQEAFTVDALAARLEEYLTLPRALGDAARRLSARETPDAAQALATLVETLMESTP